MPYFWKDNKEGDLHTIDERVPANIRHLSVIEEIGGYGFDGPDEVFSLSISRWNEEKDEAEGFLHIEFEKESDYLEFKKVLARAFKIAL